MARFHSNCFLIKKLDHLLRSTGKNDGTAVRELYRTQARLRLQTLTQPDDDAAVNYKESDVECLQNTF